VLAHYDLDFFCPAARLLFAAAGPEGEMNVSLKYIAIACVMLTLMPTLVGQKDQPSAAEKCRFITSSDLSDAKAPAFDEYPTATEEVTSAPKLNLKSNPTAARYRTVLRREMIKGPNYAGHYRLAFWGCGASCAMFAVINLKTGSVITAREFGFVLGTNLAADDFMPGTLSDGWGFRFQRNSSLLVVLGAPDENESKTGAYYFVLQREKLRLIYTTIPKKNCENAKP
jgi:hypothetical protein